MASRWFGAALALAVVAADAPAAQQPGPQAGQPAVSAPSGPAGRSLSFRFAAGSSVTGILRYLAESGGFNVVFDSATPDLATSSAISLDGVTLEDALDLILTVSNLFYAPLDATTMVVAPDSLQNRQKYERQVIRTFRLSHAQAGDLADQLIGLLADAFPQRPRPQIQPDKSFNTITVRGAASVVALAGRVIQDNDAPRAEVVVDVEILEVDRARAKAFGLNLASLTVGVQFAPNGLGSAPAADGGFLQVNPLLSGVTPSDFFVKIPDLVIRFLELDAHTKVLARPSLRGADGAKLTAQFGDEVPVPSTTLQTVGSGGGAGSTVAAVTYRPVGISISVTPHVAADEDVVLDLEVESSTRAADVSVAGQNLPSFGTRKVRTRMRLRNGESSLLAGLIRDDDRRLLAGIPGVTRVPVVRELFSANLGATVRTDVVILITPHIVRRP